MRDSVLAALIRHAIRYLIVALVAVLLRTVLLPLVLPHTVLPDLLLPVVVAVALCEDEKIAGGFGIVVGFLSDALGSTGVAVAALIYFAVGYLSSVLIRYFLRRNFPSFLIFTAVATLLALPVMAMIRAQFAAYPIPLPLIGDAVLPEMLGTVLVSPVAWLVIFFPRRRELREEMKN